MVVANLENLVSLSLGPNRLTGHIPPEIGNLANLKWLSLRGNELTGQIPWELANLDALDELWLGGQRTDGPESRRKSAISPFSMSSGWRTTN